MTFTLHKIECVRISKQKSMETFTMTMLHSLWISHTVLRLLGQAFSLIIGTSSSVGVKDTIQAVCHEDNTEDTADIFDHGEREVTNSNDNVHFPTSPTQKVSVGKDKLMPKKPDIPCIDKLSCHSIDLFLHIQRNFQELFSYPPPSPSLESIST